MEAGSRKASHLLLLEPFSSAAIAMAGDETSKLGRNGRLLQYEKNYPLHSLNQQIFFDILLNLFLCESLAL